MLGQAKGCANCFVTFQIWIGRMELESRFGDFVLFGDFDGLCWGFAGI